MTTFHPEILFSATGSDLGTCRQLIKKALLTPSYAPAEQTNFSSDTDLLKKKLHKQMAACHAVTNKKYE